MQEPILYFYKKLGINTSLIKELVCGDKYVAILLNNGNIGVCSTLQTSIELCISDLNSFDITINSHRIVVTAYYNALLNYDQEYSKYIDIFDEVEFSEYRNIVMIGFFGSLTEKFRKASINLSIFDLESNNEEIVDIKKQKEYIAKADVVILTSTTVFNNTFIDIVNSTSNQCKVFTLGPSTILSTDMFKYKNIHTIFGSVFKKNDTELLNIIRNGGGTKSFLHLMKKVCLDN